jgi:acetyl-CoA carboxylase biotin carboxylase subunit
MQAGAPVPPYYDSLLAKVIVHGSDRAEALARLSAALQRCEIAGVLTTLPMHIALTQQPEFAHGGMTTGYFQTFLDHQLAAGRN